MGRKRNKIPQHLADAWIKHWKTRNDNDQYEAFIRTMDFSSSGLRSRYPCPENDGRFYQTMSLNETFQLIHLLRDNSVLEIKEQYPFVDTTKSVAMAKAIGIKHPTYSHSSTPVVITWDFRCLMAHKAYKIFSVKPESVITQPRTRELIALEKALAEAEGYEYELVLDTDLRCIATNNYVKASFGAKLSVKLSAYYNKWLQAFCNLIEQKSFDPLLESIKKVSSDLSINLREGYRLLQHSYWLGDITSDPNVDLLPELSPYELDLSKAVINA